MQEDSTFPAPDQHHSTVPQGSLSQDTPAEWALQRPGVSVSTNTHCLQQQPLQPAAAGMSSSSTHSTPQPPDHPPPAVGHQPGPHFHPHPPPFDPPPGHPKSMGAQHFPHASPRTGQSQSGSGPGTYAIGRYPEGPAAASRGDFSGGSNEAGCQPPASLGHWQSGPHMGHTWVGHAAPDGRAFQGPPPGPTPTSSMPYAFMMPGSYPMQVGTRSNSVVLEHTLSKYFGSTFKYHFGRYSMVLPCVHRPEVELAFPCDLQQLFRSCCVTLESHLPAALAAIVYLIGMQTLMGPLAG